MKYILLIIFSLVAFPVLAYDYNDSSIQLTILDNRNWIITLDDSTYYMNWINGRLRTTGLDGTCYWYDGLEIEQCTLEEYLKYLNK